MTTYSDHTFLPMLVNHKTNLALGSGICSCKFFLCECTFQNVCKTDDMARAQMNSLINEVQKGNNPFVLMVKQRIEAKIGQITLEEVEQWCRAYNLNLHVCEYNDAQVNIPVARSALLRMSASRSLCVSVTGDPMPVDKLNRDGYVPSCSIVTSVTDVASHN